jgi:hypothetical protein
MRELQPSKRGYVYKDTVTPSGKKVGRPRGVKNSRKVNKRKPGEAPPTPKAKRGPGNPIKSPPLSPAISKKVAAAWLRGESLTSIAEQTGTHRSALARHVENHITPLFRQELVGEAVRICALLKESARVSWQRVLADRDDGNSLKLFQWSIDCLLSITGAHSPIKVDISQQYRVAGKPPELIESEMLGRLAEKIETLRHSAVSTVDADEYQTLEES